MANDATCLTDLMNFLSWTIEEDGQSLLRQLYPLIRSWNGPLPNLRDIFGKEKIDWLLAEFVKSISTSCSYFTELVSLIDFIIRTGYKDEPDQDEDGKPMLRLTTAVHIAARRDFFIKMPINVIRQLFKIYDRFDVNYVDESGFTHFHAACKLGYVDVVQKFLDNGQNPNCLPVQATVDPPLHLALISDQDSVVRQLLKRDADPNLADAAGLTPMHWAVSRLQPRLVDELLASGANLSNFVFPSENHFDESLKVWRSTVPSAHLKLRLVSGALAVIECLAKKEYALYLSDALTIVKLFAKHQVFETSLRLELDNEEFRSKAKETTIRAGLSLDDLVRLQPRQAAKQLTCQDYFKFFLSRKVPRLFQKFEMPCTAHLNEIMSREFFRVCALEFFTQLTHYRLPILCSEMIIDDSLANQDLSNVCLAVEDRSHEDSEKNEQSDETECEMKRPKMSSDQDIMSEKDDDS